MNLPDEDAVSRWEWAFTVGMVFVAGVLFGVFGSCWIQGCAPSSTPLPEPPYVVVEARHAGDDAGEDAGADAWTAVDAGPPPGVDCPAPCDPHGGRWPL